MSEKTIDREAKLLIRLGELGNQNNIMRDALEYIAGLDSSQAACAELCSAVGVAVKALEDVE